MKVLGAAMLALLICTTSCLADQAKQVSPASLRLNGKQLVGKMVVVEGCILWGRHGVAILSCEQDNQAGGVRLLDPNNQLVPAFRAVAGALPFGGQIRAEVHGTVVNAKAYPAETEVEPCLSIEKIVNPIKAPH